MVESFNIDVSYLPWRWWRHFLPKHCLQWSQHFWPVKNVAELKTGPAKCRCGGKGKAEGGRRPAYHLQGHNDHMQSTTIDVFRYYTPQLRMATCGKISITWKLWRTARFVSTSALSFHRVTGVRVSSPIRTATVWNHGNKASLQATIITTST